MKKIEWPNGKKFAVCLTHDVDRVKKTFQVITNFVLEKRPYHLFSLFNKTNPYWAFDKIMEIEKKYDVRSTFFFLKETKKLDIFNPSTYGLSLGYYDFNRPMIANIIKKLDAGGWEIGLHGSYDSYKDKKLMLKEKEDLEKVLGKPVIGIRQHFLHLDVPKTWEIQRDIGFKYDASFGYQEKLGFRDDKVYPFRPFNHNFLVIPLTIMDSTLFSSYTNDKQRWEKIIDIFNTAEKNRGVVTLLWHQRVFNEKEFPGWAKMYDKIIIECKKRNALITTAQQIWGMYQNDY